MTPLLFERREARLRALDALPRGHWLSGISHSVGALEARLAMLADLRRALFSGGLPPARDWCWPTPPIAASLAEAMNRLDLPRYCAGRQGLADTVIQSLLFHLDFIVDYTDRGADDAEAVAMAVDAFSGDWRERCRQLEELIEIFGRLPDDGKNMYWDELANLLRSPGWQEMVRLHRLLEHFPDLARLIRSLGRAYPTEREEPEWRQSREIVGTAAAFRPRRREVRIPDMPGETRGVQRSDRIARMLPAEAMLLGHPRLRLVWHARRAERTLLCYEDDDRMQETRSIPAPLPRPTPARRPGQRAERGPMLVCVDTSGSMQGGAEAVAKAVVLEAMRTAHAQGRACHLFAFGGPGEVVGMELGYDGAGLARLIDFLGRSFHGGTDVCGPLEAALAMLDTQPWRHADLLVASDGEFGATPDVAARLAAMKRDTGLRVQGVLVGDRETVGFLEIADDIFAVRDWRRLAGAVAESPVHSHRLTATYFPGALRTPGNLEATVTPAAAAAAVRRGRK